MKTLKKVKDLYQKIKKIEADHRKILKIQQQTKILSAKALIDINRSRANEIIENLHLAEFQVFSQWGDDGIIQFLISYLDIENKTFIEFGVENYREANTRFLLINNNWSGFIMDGSQTNVEQIQNDNIYWRHDLLAMKEFVTAENINQIILDNGFEGEIGLLHIDIDGNDYWIWNAVEVINPVIAIIEYNSIFGYDNPWTIPYQKDFIRTNNHYSNLFYGTSLLSLCDLAEEKGYKFIGSNSNGNNAYFIREDKIKQLKVVTAAEGYVLSKFRESRDKHGKLNFLTGEDRLKVIKGMKVYNTRSGQLVEI